MQRRFAQVDVFTTTAFRGNPVAVVLDAADLDTAQMQQLAHWTNLSETTFVLPPSRPGADYAVRIFTPVAELPFAGHPTLGTCHAWLGEGGEPARPDVTVQECAAGLVRIRRTSAPDQERLAFAAPPLVRSGPVEEAMVRRIGELLSIGADEIVDAQWVDNGPGWVAVLLADADAVLRVPARTEAGLELGVVGMYPSGSVAAIEVRAFFPKDGATVEDPVTGSLNASLAQWLLGSGRLRAPYVASQGTALGRRGRVHVDIDDDGTVWVGGGTLTCVRGRLEL